MILLLSPFVFVAFRDAWMSLVMQGYIETMTAKPSPEYTMLSNLFADTSKDRVQVRHIKCIDKVYNPIVFDKFKGELQRNLKKYQNKDIKELVKPLFNEIHVCQICQ